MSLSLSHVILSPYISSLSSQPSNSSSPLRSLSHVLPSSLNHQVSLLSPVNLYLSLSSQISLILAFFVANLKKSIFLSLFVEALGLGFILILGLGYSFLANGWFWVDFLSILGLSSLIFHCILGLIFYCYNGYWW